MEFNSILVVCAGNICRSPMGEKFFKIALEDKGYKIDSAGIVGLTNHPADDKAIKVMADIDIDISDHEGKLLNEKMISNFDLILVMTDRHINDISKKWPFSKGKLFKIGHWLDMEVADPYKLEEQVFVQARNDIQKAVEAWVDKLS